MTKQARIERIERQNRRFGGVVKIRRRGTRLADIYKSASAKRRR